MYKEQNSVLAVFDRKNYDIFNVVVLLIGVVHCTLLNTGYMCIQQAPK